MIRRKGRRTRRSTQRPQSSQNINERGERVVRAYAQLLHEVK
jgi:hypothetical protein